jgi:hypothetical protein
VQRITFLGMELDSVNMAANLMCECAQSVLIEFVQGQDSGLTEIVSKAPGSSVAAVTPLGLLHMRPLQQ